MDQELVQDGSENDKDRIAASRTGSWKSCWPILVCTAADTVILFAITTNMITYMTTVLHRRNATSASDVNNLQGTTFVMSLVGAFISDTYLGRYKTISLAFGIYFFGIILLAISVSGKSLRPLPCQNGPCPEASSLQLGIFFLALYLFALGFGCLAPCIVSFDEEDMMEKRGMVSFFNWNFWCVGLGGIIFVTAIVYIEDRLHWGWGIGLCLLFLAVAMCMFFGMTRHYRYKKPQGSPLAQIAHVLITAFKRRSMETTNDFYEEYDIKHGKRVLPHTNQFRFLDKAALKQGGKEEFSGPCTLTQVEEVKLVLKIIPIWLVVLWLGVAPAQVGTFFVTQGMNMDNELGSFSVPPASMFLFSFIVNLTFLPIYDKLVVPFMRSHTKNERGFSLLQRIGIGFVLCVLDMMVAAVVEMKRKKSSVKLNIFWLVPQYGLLGLFESFSAPALQEFFHEQMPDSMQSLGVSMAFVNSGVSFFLSSTIVYMVDNSNPTWLRNDIDKGHLDYYYWVLVLVTVINLLFYLPLAWSYSYKTTTKSADDSIELVVNDGQ